MPSASDFIFGPWRAVAVLGVTQILTWGTLYYPPVLTVPLIAAERGWSVTYAMGGFSFGLLVAGLASPRVGAAIDRLGGHKVMAIGSLIGAAGLVALVYAASPLAYLAVWTVLGAAMAASLYDPAFATLGQIFGARARSPITALTLAGGFASTVSWPVTLVLIETAGWRGAYLVYAGLLAFVAAPLHAFALPRTRALAEPPAPGEAARTPTLHPANGFVFFLVVAAYASYAFVPSALAAHLLAIFQRFNLDPATAVAIGALFGPSQVGARVAEFIFARKVHPLWVARFALTVLICAFALIAVAGLPVAVAAAFAIMFGAANGLMTITRGAVPLALFGPVGYGRTVGRIAGPALAMQAVAPVVLASMIERASDAAALALVAGFAAIALSCFLAIRQPRPASGV